MSLIVATFYKFVPIADCSTLQARMLEFCQEQEIKGTILLAPEGINGTIAGRESAITAVLTWLKADPRFADLEHKEASAEAFPFERMKVKVKQEIVTFGKPEVNPAAIAGTYVSPQAWNDLIADPDVIVIDTRNDYEVRIGTFDRAINPETNSFREFPEYVEKHLNPNQHQKIAMFCTGGIRCEKASAYLLSQGFQAVYHLQGGILKYLEEVPAEESLWQGECFVFDERIAVKHGLEPGSYEMCRSCGHPIADADKASPHYEEGITCPYCYDSLTPEKRARQIERQRQFKSLS
ncbi:MAG: rhodanese-related sulfurtransferase [Leptolyngbyaceae cyanobacterium bins.302]|nr:rhodanese-related sulfurtransferase [Leptolyngbyaceae cyanobacterium bins.302]